MIDIKERRRYGQTTGRMLSVLGTAVLNPGKEIEFVDHVPHSGRNVRDMSDRIRQMAADCGLQVSIRVENLRIYVTSTFVSPGSTIDNS